MSPREETTNALVNWLRDDGSWNAPYGILSNISANKQYRSVTFGRARTLDCEVRIYSPKYITLRTSHNFTQPVKFDSLSSLIMQLSMRGSL
jgi:hypothetical protein